jgi:hypothetical protein
VASLATVWQAVRLESYLGNGLTMDGVANFTAVAGPPWPPMSSLPPNDAFPGTQKMGPWSRFTFRGAEGVTHLSDVPSMVEGGVVDSVGWPAHYACPAGYMWLGGGAVTCLSCLPGTFSVQTGARGGPYRCTHCPLGTYSSAVGSTACTVCPSGTYADVYGSSACARCAVSAAWTYPGAQTAAACGNCPPGSANCTQCVAGQYQNKAGQAQCIQCPAGTFSAQSGAT